MDRIRVAWAAFRASSRYLFWTWVEVLSGAIGARKEAARELTGLRPKNPREAQEAGYALFLYNLSFDRWEGYWRASQDAPMFGPQYEVSDWAGVPWHSVEFSDDIYLSERVRAVEKKYADKYLKFGQRPSLKAVA